jgi:hypothetical protein
LKNLIKNRISKNYWYISTFCNIIINAFKLWFL